MKTTTYPNNTTTTSHDPLFLNFLGEGNSKVNISASTALLKQGLVFQNRDKWFAEEISSPNPNLHRIPCLISSGVLPTNEQ